MPRDNALTRSRKKQAESLFRSKQFEQARILYEQICQTDRSDAEAWLALGLTHLQLGDPAAAGQSFTKAASLRPDHAGAHHLLGNAWRDRKNHAEALAAYRRALELDPANLVACVDLGTLLEEEKSLEEAARCYERGLRHHPDSADLHFNLGNTLRELDRKEDAVAHFRRATELRPNFAQAHCNLGVVLIARGDRADAIVQFRKAAQIQPRYLEALNNLGSALFHDGQFKEAAACYRRALEIDPDQPDVCLGMAELLLGSDRPEEAIPFCHRVISKRPGDPSAHNILGLALAKLLRLEEAIQHHETALVNNPDPAMLNGLALALGQQGRVDEALDRLRQALRIKPDYALGRSNLVFVLNYTSTDQATVFAEHKRYGEIHPSPGDAPEYSNSPDPDRRLRVGYLSPDFKAHSVSHFIEPILANHDAALFEVHCYSNSAQSDKISKRLNKYVTHWRHIHHRTDAVVADMIRADGIDILVDLAGHTANHRLPVFTHRPAPVQVTYLGYPNTTGLMQMDYRITDALTDPPGQEAFHTEQLTRLPGGFLCYSPMDDAPPVAPLPSRESGSVTFGCFNSLEKFSPEVLALWAGILKGLPGSRLVLKTRSLKNPGACELLLRRFQEHGIAPDRLELLGWTASSIDHLAIYNRMDIALDTFPYNGTTTTCEALWMGVPVITLAGQRHAGRVGVSLLTQVGLTELIAQTPPDYVRLAVELAGDPERLATLRAGLRQRMAKSPLCDAGRFTRNLENAYREMWRTWCHSRGITASTTPPQSRLEDA